MHNESSLRYFQQMKNQNPEYLKLYSYFSNSRLAPSQSQREQIPYLISTNFDNNSKLKPKQKKKFPSISRQKKTNETNFSNLHENVTTLRLQALPLKPKKNTVVTSVDRNNRISQEPSQDFSEHALIENDDRTHHLFNQTDVIKNGTDVKISQLRSAAKSINQSFDMNNRRNRSIVVTDLPREGNNITHNSNTTLNDYI